MAKPVGARQARLAFHKIWRLCGEPTLQIIPPVSAWSLPAGVSFDRHIDRFVDGSGASVVVNWRDQITTEVRFLPKSDSHNAALRMLGVVVTDGMTVTILWSADIAEKVKTAWGVLLSDRLYRVQAWQTVPPGVSAPTVIELSLTEGD